MVSIVTVYSHFNGTEVQYVIVEAAKDPKVALLVIYAMRYHVHNHGFSNIGGHVHMPMYDLQFTLCLGRDQSQIILAALYLTEIINATLPTIHDDNGYLLVTTQDELTAKWQKSSLKRHKKFYCYYLR